MNGSAQIAKHRNRRVRFALLLVLIDTLERLFQFGDREIDQASFHLLQPQVFDGPLQGI
jgi:hypothetical protein